MTTSNVLTGVDKDLDDALKHYGVKGMKWGVRRNLKKKKNASERAEYITEKDAKWRTKASNPKKAVRVAKRASREATKMTKQLNAKYKKQGYRLGGSSMRKNSLDNRRNKLARSQYDTELKGILEYSLDKAALKVYKNSPSRLYQVNLSRNSDGTVSAKIAPRQNAKLDKQLASITKRDNRLKHSDEDDGMVELDGLEFKLTQDSDGFVTSVEVPGDDLGHDELSDLDDYLMHYGVKGMKWGVSKDKDKPKSKSKTTIDKTKPKVKIKEEEPAAGGGGGKANTEEDDKRELEAINEVLESGRDMKFKEFTTLLRRKSEIQKRMDARNKPDDEKSSSRKEPTALDKVPSKGISLDQLVNLNSDLTTEERIARGRKRRLEREKRNGSAKHSDLLSVKMKDIASGTHLEHDELESDLDDYLMHYGVKGMKWGVRKDRKTGRVKSVAKRTPLRGKNESGNIRNAVDNSHGGKSNHKAVRRAYLDARVPIKQGLRTVNNDDRFKGKDLTNEKSKLVKQYHKEISDMVTEKLAMSAVIKSRKNDKMVPKLEYDMSKSNEPKLTELRSKNQYDQPGIKNVARQIRDRDMNTTDKVVRVAKRGAITAAAYAAASQAVGAGMMGAMLVESLYGESTPSLITRTNDYTSDLIKKEMEKSLRQSDDDQLTVVFDPILDDLGHIVDVTFEVVSGTMSHDELSDLDAYLMHYGVKGMKWGVRKDGKPQGYQGGSSKSKRKRKSKPTSDTVNKIKSNLKKTAGNAKKTVSKITDRPKTKPKPKPKPKPKAKRELDVGKAEAEAHAIDARRDSSPSLFSPDTTKTMLTDRTRTGGMTDAELKATIQRMHLETAYAKLVRENTPKSTSQKLMAFAKETATDIAKQQVKRVAGEYAGNLVNKAIGKGLEDAKDQKKKDDSKPKSKADTPKSESKPKPKAEAPKPSPTTAPASEPKRPAPTWRPTPPGPGRPPNKPPASETKTPAPTWRPTGPGPRITPNTSNYVFGDRGRNYKGTRRAQDIIDNHATVTVAELMERRRRRERR